MTVAEALRAIDPREARMLLAATTGFSEASLLSSPERALAPDVARLFLQQVERRKSGEPIAYIVGRKEFYSLDLAVNPAVLIPRPETELLVDLVLQKKPASVLDLGTGSGAIALAIKKHLPAAQVAAVGASDRGQPPLKTLARSLTWTNTRLAMRTSSGSIPLRT